MLRYWTATKILLVTVLLIAPGLATAEEAPKGAKALFGAGNEDIFYPRDKTGSLGMDPSNQVTEEQLTSFYKVPETPGIAYSLEVLRKGENNIIAVENPRHTDLRTGDRIRLRLVPNFTGHAYVVEAKDSHHSLIYPVNYGSRENMITAGRESYVPASGWLKLVDPAEPFSMQVLFKPGPNDYPLNQPEPNPAVARVSLSEAVHREWQSRAGQKGIIFEADHSYLAAQPVSDDSDGKIDRDSYTTNYVVIDPRHQQQAAAGAAQSVDEAIAIEIPIRHVRR